MNIYLHRLQNNPTLFLYIFDTDKVHTMDQGLIRLTAMKLSKLTVILLLLFCFSKKANAQNPMDCLDTSRINPYYLCGNPIYQPVCGCNGVTYRNDCAAYYMGGVNFTSNGTCGNFGFDILENPVATNLTISVYTRQSERVIMQAWNDMGNKYYEYFFNGYENSVQQFFIDTHDYPRGVYIIVVVVNGEQQSHKVVVENMQ